MVGYWLVGWAILLTGCTKLPQDQFADGLTVQKDMNAGDFSVTIDTFEFAGEDSQNSQESMIAGMIFSQLAGTKITGNFVEDPKVKYSFGCLTVFWRNRCSTESFDRWQEP